MQILGWSLVTLGVVLLVLDVTDVAYTAVKFEDDNCDNAEDYPEWDYPCDNDDHIFAYIASGTWSSIVVSHLRYAVILDIVPLTRSW